MTSRDSQVWGAGLDAEARGLDDPAYWGRSISDERYVVVGRRLA